jgi:hypothetical protein
MLHRTSVQAGNGDPAVYERAAPDKEISPPPPAYARRSTWLIGVQPPK